MMPLQGCIQLFALLVLHFQASFRALNRRRGHAHKTDEKTVQTFDSSLQWHQILPSCFTLISSVQNPASIYPLSFRLVIFFHGNVFVLSLKTGRQKRSRQLVEQWKKEQVWPFLGCCTADTKTDVGRHQLFNNGLLVFFHCLLMIASRKSFTHMCGARMLMQPASDMHARYA